MSDDISVSQSRSSIKNFKRLINQTNESLRSIFQYSFHSYDIRMKDPRFAQFPKAIGSSSNVSFTPDKLVIEFITDPNRTKITNLGKRKNLRLTKLKK